MQLIPKQVSFLGLNYCPLQSKWNNKNFYNLCNAKTLILDTYFVVGKKDSLEPEIRRRAASLSTPHRASDVHVDPLHSAILFRDARGVSRNSSDFNLDRTITLSGYKTWPILHDLVHMLQSLLISKIILWRNCCKEFRCVNLT